MHAIAIGKSKAAAASQAIVRDVLVHSSFPARAALRILEHLLQMGPSHSSSAVKPSAAIFARVDAFVVSVVSTPGAMALAAGTLCLLHQAAGTEQLGQPRWALLACDVLGACSCYSGRDRVAACLQLFAAADAATLSCKALKVIASLAASPDLDAAGRTDLLDSLTQQLERTGVIPTAAPPAAAAADAPFVPLAARPAVTSKQVTSSVLRAVVSILQLESPAVVANAAHRQARCQLVQDRIVPHVLRLAEGHLARNASAAVVSLLTSAWTAGMSAFSLVEYIRASTVKTHNAHVQTLSAKVADVVYGLFADNVGSFLQKTHLFVAEVVQRAADPDAALAIIRVFTDNCVSDLITPAELDGLLAQSMAQPRSLDTTVCVLLLLILKTHGAVEHGLHDVVSRWALQGLSAHNGDAPVAASFDAQIREEFFAAEVALPCALSRLRLQRASAPHQLRVNCLCRRCAVLIVLQTGLPNTTSSAEREALKATTLKLLMSPTCCPAASAALLRLASRVLCHTRQEAHLVSDSQQAARAWWSAHPGLQHDARERN